ncbi:MAG: hypothetical protein LBQ49_00275, partial [Rickettsiales bacterium]|nr:hypothetical protein [Rickettsiales bacterium]
MKKVIVYSLMLLLTPCVVSAATPQRGGARGGGTATTGAAAPAKQQSGQKPVGARAAALGGSAGVAAPAAAGTTGTTTTAGRVGARGGAPAATGAAPAAAAPGGKPMSARAASTQSVVASGAPKIQTAASSAGVVDEACKEKFFGCMDSFCMQDNANGARCVCSDQVKTYDQVLSEIEKLDAQSLKLATDGVARIDMGESAAEIDKMVNDAIKNVDNTTQGPEIPNVAGGVKKRVRKSIDVNAFNNIGMDMPDFSTEQTKIEVVNDPLAGLTGNALGGAVTGLCLEQVGKGCEKDTKMLQMMYSAQIKGDCSGYELELKKRRNASQQKLAAAQTAMKEAALEKFEEQNKYDLGQCIVEMEKCITTTGGCGSDFSKCTYFNTGQGLSGAGANTAPTPVYKNSSILVGRGTLDTIEKTRPICEAGVVKYCVAVKDQVWPMFL